MVDRWRELSLDTTEFGGWILGQGEEELSLRESVLQDILLSFFTWFLLLGLWDLHIIWKCGTLSPNFQCGDLETTVHLPALSFADHFASKQIFEKINCIAKKGGSSSLKKYKSLLVPWNSAHFIYLQRSWIALFLFFDILCGFMCTCYIFLKLYEWKIF